MSQTLHQIYQSKAIVVTRTMVVKFHKIALSINETLVAEGYTVDESDPRTWKYYMNMWGEYHQADHDRLLKLTNGEHRSMRIKVAGETQPVEIDFNKPNLSGANGDVAIANEYRFNTFYFNEIVAKYPEFEDLILGILNPVNLDISTNAYEGEILYCGGYLKTQLPSGIYHYVRQDYGIITDNFLIETNEENVIHKLQDHISNNMERWWNSGYGVTSNLFLHTFIGLLFMSIPQALSNARLGNAKTPMAHSFHIREHLESWGGLGWVTEYLPKDVLLWLYRNAVWLNSNRGKNLVFENIIDNVLTPTNIPISGFRLRHDVSKMDGDNLIAVPYMEQYKLNFARNASPLRSEVDEIIRAEVGLATDNYYDQEGQAKRVSEQSAFSMFDDLNTKVLESTVVDTANQVPVTLEDIALNFWCFTASHGEYKGTVIFSDPVSNERIQLTPLNAYILAFYCLNKGWSNYEWVDIPTMYARLIPRHPTWSPTPEQPVRPTIADILKGIKPGYIKNAEILDIINGFVPVYKHNSTTTFGREVERIHEESLARYYKYSALEDMNARAYGEWTAHKCYWYDVECPLTKTKTKYRDWLNVQGLNYDNYTRQDFVDLGLKIVEAAVGVNLTRSDELRNKRSAVLAILKHFSSYTVQIIQNTVASDSFWLDYKHLRLTNIKSSASSRLKAKLPTVDVRDNWSIREGVLKIEAYTTAKFKHRKEVIADKVRVDIHDLEIGSSKESGRIRAKIPTLGIVGMTIPDITRTDDVKRFEYLVTGLYPFGEQESLSANARVVNTMSIMKPGFKQEDDLMVNSRLMPRMVLKYPELDSPEYMITTTTVTTLSIYSPSTQVSDSVMANAKLGGVVRLSLPKDRSSEEMVVSGRVVTLQIRKPSTTMTDTLTANVRISQTIRLTPNAYVQPEQLTAVVTVKSMTMYVDIPTNDDELVVEAKLINDIKIKPE